MSSLIVNQGLNVIADRASGINGPPAAILSMSVDDAGAMAAGHTKLNDGASYTQHVAVAFDATFPSRSGQVVTHQGTWTTAQANFTIKRVILHNIAFGSVTATSTNIVGGVDGQSILKTTDFQLTVTLKVTYASA